MANTIKEAADKLCEELTCDVVLARLASNVQLVAQSGELCGPCPKCGGKDRFYITRDRKQAACRQCHSSRMDAVGLAAWLKNVTMHEAVDLLKNESPVKVTGEGHHHSSPVTNTSDEWCADKWQWRMSAGQEAERNYQRLLNGFTGAKLARQYLLSRGLQPEVWRSFTVGYDGLFVPGNKKVGLQAAISWPVKDIGGGTYAIKYRYLQEQPVYRKKEPLRYTSKAGSRLTGQMFGAQLMFAFSTAPLRALVICEGEINAMSVVQACGPTHVDALSFCSESQRTLPAWAVELAANYGVVITWTDKPEVSREVAKQLPHAIALRSPVYNGVQMDANACLTAGTLGGIIQTIRLRDLDARQRESVLWRMWDVKDRLDAGQIGVARKLAGSLGIQWDG